MPTTFANSINSNPIYADRAEHDADGNLISTTYATKAELPEGVPTVTSSDDGKVLTADYTGGVASYSWETPSGGGSTYRAGTGTAITANNEVNVVVGSGLSIGSSTSSIGGDAIEFSSSVVGVRAINTWSHYTGSNVPEQVHIILVDNVDPTKYAVSKYPFTCRTDGYGSSVIDDGDVIPISQDINDYTVYNGYILKNGGSAYVAIVGTSGGTAPNGETIISGNSYFIKILNKLDVFANVREVPSAVMADSGKVLTVNNYGTPGWAAANTVVWVTYGDQSVYFQGIKDAYDSGKLIMCKKSGGLTATIISATSSAILFSATQVTSGGYMDCVTYELTSAGTWSYTDGQVALEIG